MPELITPETYIATIKGLLPSAEVALLIKDKGE